MAASEGGAAASGADGITLFGLDSQRVRDEIKKAMMQHATHPLSLPSAAGRKENNLKHFENYCLRHGAMQGQNLGLTVLFVHPATVLFMPRRLSYLSSRRLS